MRRCFRRTPVSRRPIRIFAAVQERQRRVVHGGAAASRRAAAAAASRAAGALAAAAAAAAAVVAAAADAEGCIHAVSAIFENGHVEDLGVVAKVQAGVPARLCEARKGEVAT